MEGGEGRKEGWREGILDVTGEALQSRHTLQSVLMHMHNVYQFTKVCNKCSTPSPLSPSPAQFAAVPPTSYGHCVVTMCSTAACTGKHLLTTLPGHPHSPPRQAFTLTHTHIDTGEVLALSPASRFSLMTDPV